MRRAGTDVFAIGNTCPHAGYPLGDGDIEDLDGAIDCAGKLDAPVVSCPAHSYLFDLRRGTCITEKPRCDPAAVFPVELRDGRVFLGTQPKTGGEIGARVLTTDEANKTQLAMVGLALERKYPESA